MAVEDEEVWALRGPVMGQFLIFVFVLAWINVVAHAPISEGWRITLSIIGNVAIVASVTLIVARSKRA